MTPDEYKSYVDYYGQEYMDSYYADASNVPVNNESSGYEIPVNNESSGYDTPPASTTPPASLAEQYGMTQEEYAAYEEQYYKDYYDNYYKNLYDVPVNNESSGYAPVADETPVNNESSDYAQAQADYEAQLAEYNRQLAEEAAYQNQLAEYQAQQDAYNDYMAANNDSSSYYNNDSSSYYDTSNDYVNNESSGYYKKGGSIQMKKGGLPRFYTGGSSNYDKNYMMDEEVTNSDSSSYYDNTPVNNDDSNYYTQSPDANNDTSGYYDSTPVNNDTSDYYTPVNNDTSGYYDSTPVNNYSSGYADNAANNDSSSYNTPVNNIPVPPLATPAPPNKSTLDKAKDLLTSPTAVKAGLGLAGLYQLMDMYEKRDAVKNHATMPAFQGPANRTTPFGMGAVRTVNTGKVPYQFPSAMEMDNFYSNLGVPSFARDYEDPVDTYGSPRGSNFVPDPPLPEGMVGTMGGTGYDPTTGRLDLGTAGGSGQSMAEGGMATNPDDMPYFTYGKVTDPMAVMGVSAPVNGMAKGGLPRTDQKLPPMVEGRYDYRESRAVVGEGDGQSDDIPAMLADGEYVFDSDLVAALGNGSNKAGAEVLDKFREQIRAHKRSAPIDKIPPKAKSPLAYLKEVTRG